MDPVKSEDGEFLYCYGCRQWLHWRLYNLRAPHRNPTGKCGGCRSKALKRSLAQKEKAENAAWFEAHRQGNTS